MGYRIVAKEFALEVENEHELRIALKLLLGHPGEYAGVLGRCRLGRTLLVHANGMFSGSPMPVIWHEGWGWREVAQGRAIEIRRAQELKQFVGRVEAQIHHWRALGKDELADALEQYLLKAESCDAFS